MFGEIVVSHHRQDGRGRELVVEVHEGLDGLVIAAELPQDVVPGLDGLFAGAGGLLDVVEGAEGLLELLFLEIQVQEVVQDLRLVRELRQDALVHLDDHVVLAGGVIEVRQAALVPVVVRVQLHGLAEVGGRRVGVAQHRLVQAQVIPDGVVVGSRLGKGLEQGAGLRVVAVIVEGHRVHQLVFYVLRKGEGTQQKEQAGQQNPSSHVR